MNNNKQSSVDVLFFEMYNIISFYAGDEQDALCEKIKEQTKAMHKEEICAAFRIGEKFAVDYYLESELDPDEQYYNETFNNNGNNNSN